VTPAGIEPAIFRFVTQHLKHCATTVPFVTQIPRGCHKQVIGSGVSYSFTPCHWQMICTCLTLACWSVVCFFLERTNYIFHPWQCCHLILLCCNACSILTRFFDLRMYLTGNKGVVHSLNYDRRILHKSIGICGWCRALYEYDALFKFESRCYRRVWVQEAHHAGKYYVYLSRWPRGLRRRSTAARLLRLWVRIPPGACLPVVSVVCCQVEVSATHWSLVQRSATYCDASLCVI